MLLFIGISDNQSVPPGAGSWWLFTGIEMWSYFFFLVLILKML